jgi:peptide deformylase
MALEIITIEQPEHASILKSKASPVTFPLNEENSNLITAMKEKLYELGGVGLAAPQVNQSKQIITIYIPDEAVLLREEGSRAYPMHVMINPSYEAIPHCTISYDFEACYSVATKAGKVPRFTEIKINYFDESGQLHQQIEKGFYARVLQHEIDHIQGVLFTDRLTADCTQGSIQEMRELRRAELSSEKRALFDAFIKKK